jgi:hypothetical protein
MSETTTTTTGGALLSGGAAPAEPAGTPPAGTPPAGSAAGARGADTDLRDWLPEEFRADPVFKDIKDPGALAKSYANAARMIGLDKGQVLRLPADEAAPEWAEIYGRLGRPEKPEGYQFGALPEGLLPEVEPAAREAFHKLGLSARQAAGVMELYGGQVTAAQEARATRAAEIEAAVVRDLKAEYGDAFDDRIHAANRAIAELGGKELGELLATTVMPDGTRLGNHPLLVKAWAEIGKRIAEPADLRGGTGTGNGNRTLTPAEAQEEIARLRADKEFYREFSNLAHPNRPQHLEKWNRLHAMAYPSAA